MEVWTSSLEEGWCKAGGTWGPLGLLRVLHAGQSPGSPHLQHSVVVPRGTLIKQRSDPKYI